ncbi:DUF1343 domain-containing protein [bacterium]|nr:MAG: DUF1343 domain-containing protein [bacterium]
MPVKTGLDIFCESGFQQVWGKKFALLCHPASVDSNLTHILDILVDSGNIPDSIFAPEHGFYGSAQDQIGVDSSRHPRYGIQVISLYGETFDSLYPNQEYLKNIDVVLIELQDVGASYYTFVWAAVMVMEIAAKTGTKVIVLDRPNPIGGKIVQGTLQEDDYLSFVGLYPLPIRHGMTIGEILYYVNEEFGVGADLEIVRMKNWSRDMWFDETGLFWVQPSPNMPTLDTATVYPGMCLLEGTNISEGRGTTRPFEIFGAPFIQPYNLCESLSTLQLTGVHFRPIYFSPTFNKYKGTLCGGIQLHITDKEIFNPVRTGIAVVKTCFDLYPGEFKFIPPPYEYENEKLPFDILCGSSCWREMISDHIPLVELLDAFDSPSDEFCSLREKYLIYG